MATTLSNVSAKDFESLDLFYESLYKFVELCHEVWPECEETEKYMEKLKIIKSNHTMINMVVEKWHNEFRKPCWRDAKNKEQNLYDAIDKKNVQPFEVSNMSILNKFRFKEKLAEIKTNPNQKEVEEEINNVMKHIRGINTYSRMICSIDADVRRVMQEQSASIVKAFESGEKVDLRPIKIGEQIINKYSTDSNKKEKVLRNIVDNVAYLMPALNNMQEEMEQTNPKLAQQMPNLNEFTQNMKVRTE
jgi:hypothetical protein